MKKAKLFWVDLEMTGLEPEKDKILEVAAVATGWDLKPMGEYRGVVRVDEGLLKERMVGEFWEKNTKEIEKELNNFVDRYFGEEVILAGNSIHQDRKFIEREMKELNKRLHYRMLDVSAWKVYFEGALGKKFVKPEEHRALSDIMGSIEELKYYLTFMKKEAK